VGTSNFNFYEWGRQMGLKMPDLAGIEFASQIQPTVNLGDFANLTPVHAPPTCTFGGQTGVTVGEFPFFQIQSLARGGTVLLGVGMLGTTLNTKFAVRDTVAPGAANIPANAVWSNVPPVALVSAGTHAVRLLDDIEFPFLEGPGNNGMFPMGGSLWLPPGRVFFVEHGIAGGGLTFNILAQDVPASEGGE